MNVLCAAGPVWKSNFGHPTTSTRRFPRDRVGSMDNLTHWLISTQGHAPAREHQFTDGVAGRRAALDLDGQDAEEEDLDRRAGGVPEGARDLCGNQPVNLGTRSRGQRIVDRVGRPEFDSTQPETPYCQATLEDCKSVAAHVHCETMTEAVRPILTSRPAVLKNSDLRRVSKVGFVRQVRDWHRCGRELRADVLAI